MTAQFFAYKGNLGVTIDMKNGVFINDPLAAGQLGCVISTKEIEMSPEAVELIKNAGREGGSFAPLMLTKHADGSGASIGVMGAGYVHLGTDFKIGRTCEKEILSDCTIEAIEAPDGYKTFIDTEVE